MSFSVYFLIEYTGNLDLFFVLFIQSGTVHK